MAREDVPGDSAWWRTWCAPRGSVDAGGAAARTWRAAARVHGARGLRGAGGAAADAQRQGGPQGAARARRRRVPEAGGTRPRARRAEESLAGIWARAAGPRAGGRRRQLLRARRPLAAGDAGALAAAPGLRRGAAAARRLRGAHPGGARGRAVEARPAPRRSAAAARAGAAGRASCRCPSRRSGCGSSSSSTRDGRPTTSPPPCGCRAARPRLPWRASLAALVRRHEALRTTLPGGGRPAVAGHRTPAAAVPLPLVDLGGLPAEAREREGSRLGRGGSPAAVRPRPGAAVAGRAGCAWKRSEHLLLLTLHHIVSDGWSTGVLVRELSAPVRRLRRRDCRRRCRRCRCSTRTSPAGSGAGCRAKSWRASWATGGSGWRERRRCSTCPPTGRVRRSAACGAGTAGCDSPRPSRRRSPPWRGSAAPRCSWSCWRRSRRCSTRYTRAGGPQCGHAHRGPQPDGDRGAHRLLRQHPGAAHGGRGRGHASARCWSGCGRRRWAPTPTRTCRSSGWWRSCSRSGA